MTTLRATLQSRGSGLLDNLPANAGMTAASVAFEKLSEHDRALVSDCADRITLAVQSRGRSVSLGPIGSLELLAAIGRLM